MHEVKYGYKWLSTLNTLLKVQNSRGTAKSKDEHTGLKIIQ